MSDSYVTPLLISTLVANLCIASPLVAFGLYKYLQFRHIPLIQKRYPNIVILLNICALLFLTIDRTFNSVVSAMWRWEDSNFSGLSLYAVDYTSCVTYGFLAPTIHFCALWRYWMILYEFKLRSSVKENEWMRIISKSEGSARNDWWFRNAQTFGNAKWVFWFIFIPYLCAAIIISTVYILNTNYVISWYAALIVDEAMFYLPIGLIIIIWMLTPKFEDQYHVRSEMLIFSVIITIDIISGAVINQVFANSWYWSEIAWLFDEAIVLPLMCLTTTLYVVRCAQNEISHHNRYSELSQSGSPRKKSQSNTAKQNPDSLLESYLLNKKQFSRFMEYLNTEFSQECLLALVEFTQYKERMMSDKEFMTRLIKQLSESEYDHILEDGRPTSQSIVIIMSGTGNRSRGNSISSKTRGEHLYDSLPELQRIVESGDLKYTSELRKKMRLIQLYPDIIKSDIVYENAADTPDYFEMAYALYSKYISDSFFNVDFDCDISLQINIGSGLRFDLDRIMSQRNNDSSEDSDDCLSELRLFQLFDGCIHELSTLLRFSFYNFRRSKWFQN